MTVRSLALVALMLLSGCERICGDPHPEWAAVQAGMPAAGAGSGGAGSGGGGEGGAGVGGMEDAGSDDPDGGADDAGFSMPRAAGGMAPPVAGSPAPAARACAESWVLRASVPLPRTLRGLVYDPVEKLFWMIGGTGAFTLRRDAAAGAMTTDASTSEWQAIGADPAGGVWLLAESQLQHATAKGLGASVTISRSTQRKPVLAVEGPSRVWWIQADLDVWSFVGFQIPSRSSVPSQPFYGPTGFVDLSLTADGSLWYFGASVTDPGTEPRFLGRVDRMSYDGSLGPQHALSKNLDSFIPVAMVAAGDSMRAGVVAVLSLPTGGGAIASATASTMQVPEADFPRGTPMGLASWRDCGALMTYRTAAGPGGLERVFLTGNTLSMATDAALATPKLLAVSDEMERDALLIEDDSNEVLLLFDAK